MPVSFSFQVRGTPDITAEAPKVINLFSRDNSGGGYNLDGVTTSLGDAAGPPVANYKIILTLAPTQREPGQSSTMRIEVRLSDQRTNQQFTIALLSSNQTVAPLPSSVITDLQGVVVMEVVAASVGAATISASAIIDGVTYGSQQVSFIVITQEAGQNYDATGGGVVVLSLENSLSRGLFALPERLAHEEQILKYPDDTGLRRVAQYETMEVIFIPSFLQK